jgi:uracil-DNA glycosylase
MLIDTPSIQIDPSRKSLLADEFAKPYFAHIKEFLLQEKQAGHIVYPK